MTQSSKDKNETFTVTTDSGSYTIDLNNTYGTTTTYLDNEVYITDTGTDYTYNLDNSVDWGTISINGSTDYTTNIDTTFANIFEGYIDKDEVEKMCKEYPGLDKAYKNFKAVYDMCKQDYEGKKKAGEIDDDVPF